MSSRVSRGLLPVVLAGLCFFALSLGLNHARGAVESGFGAFDDEPSHLLTGLMVRDFLAQGCPDSPLRFAEEYYLHYPKVAFGQWPPVFYVFQAAWTLLLGTSPWSLIALMSLFSALAGLAVSLALRETCGPLWAFVAGGLFLLLPLVQTLGASVMTELPLALLCFLAAGRFGKFLDGGRARDVLAFAGLSVLAILTKGSALALAFVPPIGVLLSGRWRLLARPALWGAGGLVVLLCLPWFLYTWPLPRTTWAGGPNSSWSYFGDAGRFYLCGMVRLGGVGMTALAVLGLLGVGGRQGKWAAEAALLASLLFFYALVPSGLEERNLVLAAPVWVFLAVRAAFGIAARFPRMAPAGVPLPLVLLAGLFAVERWELPRKEFEGYGAAARSLLADRTLDASVFLVASDSLGEGLFIGAVALAEERPGHLVLRGSKVLSSADWMGNDYVPFYRSPEELAGFLRSVPVGVVLLDLSTVRRRWRSYHDLLKALLEESGGAWRLRAAQDVVRGGVRHPGALLIYEQAGHQRMPRGELDRSRILSRLRPGKAEAGLGRASGS